MRVGNLLPIMAKLKALRGKFTEEEIRQILGESYPNMDQEIDFEAFLRVRLLWSIFFFFFTHKIKKISAY